MIFSTSTKIILLFALFGLMLPYAIAKAPQQNMTRKKFEQMLMDQTVDHRITLVSELVFDASGMVTMAPCANCTKIQMPIRWIPVVPMAILFENHPCYKEKICINKKGIRINGLSCCEKIMPDYHRRRFDPRNYVPEISLYAAKIKPTADHSHPALPMEYRGFIARTYLAMMRKYHLKLSYDVVRQYERWDRDYPPKQWEKPSL